MLSLKEYLNLIEKYLRELLEEYKQKGEWKVQLTIEVNFISLKPGSDETRIMYTRSDNIEIMFGDDNDDIIEQLFESLLKRYDENLQNKMRGSEFEFDGINFLCYDFNKTSINRGGSYIDSPKWLKDKKSTINPKNNDDKCFQYAVTLALNLDNIKKDPQRVSKIKPFIEKYNWGDIDFPSTSKDWKKFECNNEVELNILYVPYNTKQINIAYKSKNNLTQKRQIILLMISDGPKWHYLVVKNISRLLRGICINNPNESSTTKINKHTPSGYSIFTHCSFDKSKNKLNYYRGKDCMKKFSKDLREHASKIIDYEKKKMIPLTTEEKIYHNKQKICYICKKYYAAHNICNLRYKVPKEIPIVFHNGSIYDYHFIIKELVKEFEGNFECLGENTEKYIRFSVPIKKKIQNKDLEITYKIKFIDSYFFYDIIIFMTSLPSKESFYSNLNMEDIDDIDYRHDNNAFNKFRLNNLGDYHDLYVQSDTLLTHYCLKTLETCV